jgi:hypothetical protein
MYYGYTKNAKLSLAGLAWPCELSMLATTVGSIDPRVQGGG